MGKGQKVITITLWAVLVTAMVGVVAGKLLLPHLGGRPVPGTGTTDAGDALPVLYPAAEFALTDQDNKPFASTALRGRPWVCGFMFTTCGEVCPKMTKAMVDLQPKLPADVELVSFSVNPEHDTPAVLKEYAATWRADESRWRFLTGTSEQMFGVAAGMKMAARPADGDQPILHDRRLILVDAAGNVRGFYSSADDQAMARLAADARRLSDEAKQARPAGAPAGRAARGGAAS